jgi:hypothetical protein
VALQALMNLADWAAAAGSLSRLHQTVLGWHVVSTSNPTAALIAILTLKLSHYPSGRRLGERRYNFYSFSTSALDGGERSASRPGCALIPGKDPGTHWIGGWVGIRTGLDTDARRKIFCLCRGSNIDRPGVQPVARHYTDWATRLTILTPLKVNSYICSLFNDAFLMAKTI